MVHHRMYGDAALLKWLLNEKPGPRLVNKSAKEKARKHRKTVKAQKRKAA